MKVLKYYFMKPLIELTCNNKDMDQLINHIEDIAMKYGDLNTEIRIFENRFMKRGKIMVKVCGKIEFCYLNQYEWWNE